MTTTQVNMYPNPFTNNLSLEVLVDTNLSAIVQILDQSEKIIKMMSWNLKKGTNKTTFEDLQSLPPGEYLLDIKNIDGTYLFDAKLSKL